MGIPGLQSQLQQYAIQCIWKASSDSAANPVGVLIDGPSFAHYIYFWHVIMAKGTLHSFSSFADYKAIASTAIKWLEKLESCGVHIKWIFFDGNLPRDKFETRMSRLQQQFSKILQLNFSIKFKQADSQIEQQLARIIPTFLVPCILESLCDSKYGKRTFVVPGEADTFCTHEMFCSTDDVILTDDSDCIAGSPLGYVAFLSWILPRQGGTLGDHFRVQLLRATDLQRRLGGGSDCIRRACFVLQKNPRWSLPKCVHESKRDLGQFEGVAYSQFLSPVHHLEADKSVRHILQHSLRANTFQDLLYQLDPRLSELVQDMLNPENRNRNYMTLPVLVEDVVRPSAWRLGSPVRFMAYSILADQLGHGMSRDTFEIDRRGQNFVAEKVVLEHGFKLQVVARGFIDHLNYFLKMKSGMYCSKCMQFFIAMDIMLQQLRLTESLPGKSDLISVIRKDESPPFKISSVHLRAMFHACLYSMRILGQVLDLVLAFRHSPDNHFTYSLEQDIDGYQELAEFFQFKPTIEVLFSGQYYTSLPEHKDCRLAMEGMISSYY